MESIQFPVRVSDQLHVELDRRMIITYCNSLVEPMERLDIGRADTNGAESENLIRNSFEMTGVGSTYHQIWRYFGLRKSLSDRPVQTREIGSVHIRYFGGVHIEGSLTDLDTVIINDFFYMIHNFIHA